MKMKFSPIDGRSIFPCTVKKYRETNPHVTWYHDPFTGAARTNGDIRTDPLANNFKDWPDETPTAVIEELTPGKIVDMPGSPADWSRAQTEQRQRLDQQQVGGDHYARMDVTPWQFLEACLTPEEFRGYLKGEAIVYLARERAKGGKADVSKARHVLQKLEELDSK